MGAYLLLTTIVIVLSMAPVVLPDLIGFSGVGFLVTAAMAYLLLGDQDGRWLTGVTIIIFIADGILINTWAHDLFQVQLDKTSSATVLLSMSVLVLVMGVLIVRMIVLGQERLFRETQFANLEIEKRANEEQEAKTRLENTVSEYMAFVQKVTEGDLGGRLEFASNGLIVNESDDLYVLGWNLNVMVESLSEMAVQVREAAASVSSAATEIQAAASQQVASSAEQDAAVTQTVTTVEEVRATVMQTAERAQSVADSSQESVNVSHAGKEAVASTIEGSSRVAGR